MLKSINQWSFPAHMTVREMMAMAKEWAYDAFEPALSAQGELSLASSDAEFTAIKDYAAEIGIQIASLASGLSWGCSPTSNDPQARAKARGQLTRQMECAALLGTDAILHVPGMTGVGFWGGDETVEYDACYDRALENLSSAKVDAEAMGVTIGVENVWNNFLLSPLEARSFLDQIGSPRVAMYLDVGNIIKYGQPETWVRILGKRVCRVHVKDYKRSVGTLEGFVDLLSGDVDFPAVIAELKAAGYAGPLTAEMNNGHLCYPENIVARTSRALDIILGR